MLIDFSQIKEVEIPGMNDGTGEMSARMYMDEHGKIIPTTIHPGGSIGLHKHPTSDDINYVISGTGKAVCDGQEEILNLSVFFRNQPLWTNGTLSNIYKVSFEA